ncbi:amidohydrolase family protein [soil metagenome]
MDADWLPFHPNPTKPAYRPPAGAVDAHCHVFGPEAQFPYAPERKYTPCDAGKDRLFALRDFLGFSRNVVVQATCHGKDNRALVDALRASGGLARGVATVGEEITEVELQALHDAGVRGVRFNFLKRLADFTPHDVLQRIAAKVAPLGWHVVVYFEAPDLEELQPLFSSLPTKVVVDHMGRPDVALGVDHPQFQRFVRWMEEDPDVWSKVSCPERLSLAGPPYDDVVPFQKLLVERFPDRVLWGSDWPHPNLKGHMADDGLLTDQIPKFAPTDIGRHKLLIDNPMALYWGDDRG